MIKIITVYCSSKIGMSQLECEDSFMMSHDLSIVAVSDGATECSYSKEWSYDLVEHFVAHPTLSIDNEWLSEPRRNFYSRLNQRILPWHTLEKLSRGTFASLSGLIFDDKISIFSVVNIGDSCIAWKNSDGKRFLPYSSPDEFSQRPTLLSTTAHSKDTDVNSYIMETCELPQGTTYFFIMTDAIGHWFLRDIYLKNKIDDFVIELENREAFVHEIEYRRLARNIKNDDLTMIVLKVTK